LSTAPSSATSRGAFSLAEIIVGLALIALIMVSIDKVLLSGTRYLSKTTLTTELQQACVLASGRLVTELLESSSLCIRGDTSPAKLFVTFGSPRNKTGRTTFDAAGELQWNYRVGFYIAPRGDEPALYRKEDEIDPPVAAPPLIPASYDQNFWMAHPSSARQIANRVYYLDVVSATNINVILGVRSRDEKFLISIKTKLKARN